MKKGKEWIKGLWKEHPVFRMLLGMCPTLAVTTSVINAIFMGVAVIFVLFFSSLIVSLIRKLIPPQVRIAVYTVIIASFVTIVDIYFKANFPQMSKALGPYVPLIIVNCIILGRCEAFASKNRLIPSLIDALSIGIGFFWGLVVLGAIREILGTGRVLGIKILSASYYNPMVVMILPAGAFLVLGGLVAIMNKLEGR